MVTIEERLEEFKKLSFEDQKTKMILMLTDLKDADTVFADLLAIVQTNTTVDSVFLADIYQDIMHFAEAIADNDQSKSEKQITMLHEKIKKLHEIEDAERAKENPDGNLEVALTQI